LKKTVALIAVFLMLILVNYMNQKSKALLQAPEHPTK
jgi:hypothetical protein